MHEVHFLRLFAQSSLRDVTCFSVLMFPPCRNIALIFAIHELLLWGFRGCIGATFKEISTTTSHTI
jgi:hypothetical protein